MKSGLSLSEIQKILGPEFDVKEGEYYSDIEIKLRLTSIITISRHLDLSREIILCERNRILIMFTRELKKLLLKYLGEVPE